MAAAVADDVDGRAHGAAAALAAVPDCGHCAFVGERVGIGGWSGCCGRGLGGEVCGGYGVLREKFYENDAHIQPRDAEEDLTTPVR